MSFAHSDGIEIVGNHLFRCGGPTTADADITAMASVGMELHHNDLYGSGQPNGTWPVFCTAGNWKFCKNIFHRTDGYTATNKDECGTRMHHNRVYNHRGTGENPNNDGDGLDLKNLDCSGNPVHVYQNEFVDNGQSTQVVFRLGAHGVRFYNNIIRDGQGKGIAFLAGQDCEVPDRQGLHDFRIFNNIILRNADFGLRVRLATDECGSTYEWPDIYDIKIFNNLFKDNGRAGLYVGWVTDDELGRGTTDVIGAEAWDIALDFGEILDPFELIDLPPIDIEPRSRPEGRLNDIGPKSFL